MTPAERLMALFQDGGAAVLAEAERSSWEAAARGQTLSDGDGEALLTQLRDNASAAEDVPRALAYTKALYKLRRDRLGDEDALVLWELAALGAWLVWAGRADEGGSRMHRAWDGLNRIKVPADAKLASLAGQIGLYELNRNEHERARAYLEAAYRIRKDIAPQSVALSAALYGEVMLQLGHPDEAAELLLEAWYLERTERGLDDHRALKRAWTAAQALVQAQRFDEALPPLRAVYDDAKRRGDEALRARAGFELGLVLDNAGNPEEALRVVEDVVRITRRRHEQEPEVDLPSRLSLYARLLAARGRVGEAEGLLLEAVEIERMLSGDDSPLVGARYAELGAWWLRSGRVQEALGMLDVGASLLRSGRGDEHPQTRKAVEWLVDSLARHAQAAKSHGDRRFARALADRAVALGEQVLGVDHRATRNAAAVRD